MSVFKATGRDNALTGFADVGNSVTAAHGRKRVHDADDAMARITADRLVRHLEQSGFVLMRRLPGIAPAVGNVPVR